MIEINLYKSIVESVPFSPDIQRSDHRRIGYGHIMSTGEPLSNGITEGAARALLRLDIQKLTNWVCNHVRVQITPQRLGALILFAYAVGRIEFAKSELLKAVNDENWEAVDSLVKPQWKAKTICRL